MQLEAAIARSHPRSPQSEACAEQAREPEEGRTVGSTRARLAAGMRSSPGVPEVPFRACWCRDDE
jgi:hypothetical protein